MTLFPDDDQGGTITAISPTKRDPNRASIKVDRKYVITLDRSTIDAMRLAVGTPWNDELRKRADDASVFEKARLYAIRSLTRRMRPAADMRDRLKRRGIEDSVADRVIEDMQRITLLDDRACAEAIVREITRARPAGRRFLMGKLRQKRVPDDIAREVVDDALRGTDPIDEATGLAVRRAATMPPGLDPSKTRNRLYAYLARRGFDSDACARAVEVAIRPQPTEDT